VALGAALAPYLDTGAKLPNKPMRHAYLGPSFDDDAIEPILCTYKLRYTRLSDVAAVAAELLSQGKILGWFQGRMEFGPRALGSRSILADPRDREMNAKVNNAVKFREWWRPFAPSLKREVADDYLESATDSPFMILTAQVRPEKRGVIPSVTHVDGSARVQTVSEEENPRVHRLLWLVAEHTGQPVMINTSLNRRGEPIVETPSQAVELLLGTHLSGLVLGDWFVRPVSPPGLALTLADRVALAPGTRLFSELVGDRPEARIEGRSVEGKGVRVPNWCFDLLCAAAPGRRLGSLLREHCPEDLSADVALGFLSALHSKCLLVVTA